jgi:hypothetical protein
MFVAYAKFLNGLDGAVSLQFLFLDRKACERIYIKLQHSEIE